MTRELDDGATWTDDGGDGARGVRGQSTVEYALVLMAFLSMSLTLGILWHAARSGRLLDLATQASSHQLGGGDALGEARDLALF